MGTKSRAGDHALKLGDVLKKERQARGLSAADVCARLGIPEQEYERIEQGLSPGEKWGPILAKIAIRFELPTSRLISDTGRADDACSGECGRKIRGARERRGHALEATAEYLELTQAEYAEVEAGRSPIESCGPLLLRFAEVVEQPIFNLFYPCGIAFEKLEDYP
jgi:transcriptional regulator with XRE-family HTH domain